MAEDARHDGNREAVGLAAQTTDDQPFMLRVDPVTGYLEVNVTFVGALTATAAGTGFDGNRVPSALAEDTDGNALPLRVDPTSERLHIGLTLT